MTLLLVRHGQASFGSDDYDRLSDLGHEQARHLGAWLHAHGRRPARVIGGGMRRHRETWAAMAEAWVRSGDALPEPEHDPAFAEFDHHAVISGFLAEHPDHPATRLLASGQRPEPREVLDLLVAAITRWSKGGAVGDSESWAGFRDRTIAALQRMDARAGDGEVWVISSGGVISQLVRHALQAPDDTAVRLNLALRNSAMTELKAHDDRWHLHSWNELPHLSQHRGMWTYY
ncbi:histidine phosphatase family protein [Alkalisalibacterium limincola]|uniref:Histidine phosphatase family protein n=1 Tax=Alkalisalibacterium limincola TaxID=2699169 RepID=A0A5C8KNW1_9GAMM|nr:histidine phosphatase family protein [Alkalisalibacterium limincola]TXK62667.1 histidine phosphatase family protein [Alkalisalibacterium limincola]